MGRLALDVGRDTSTAYNYFLDQYQRNGWGLISASRGKTSLLVFTKPDRSATIEISEGGALSGPNLVIARVAKTLNHVSHVGLERAVVQLPCRLRLGHLPATRKLEESLKDPRAITTGSTGVDVVGIK